MSAIKNLLKRFSKVYSVLPFGLLENPQQRAIGPDLSRWNESYDPEKGIKTVDFAITKATEGLTWVDPKLSDIWIGMKKVPIRGLYHYQRSGYSWLAQADNFLKVCSDYDHHFLALDVEGINNTISLTDPTFFQDSYRILQYLKSKTNSKIVLYTNPNLFQNYLYPIWVKYFGKSGESEAMTISLWIAQYWFIRSSDKDPGMPKQRSTWDIWQWTDRANASEYGAGSKALDMNVYKGSSVDMRSWLGIKEDPIPEENEPETDQESPIEITDLEPQTESELWLATVSSLSPVNVRNFPKVSISTDTRSYAAHGEKFIGKLWVGNDYLWINVVDEKSIFNGKWIAVRNISQTIKLLSLEKIVSSQISFFRVKHDIELGHIWRKGLPEVHPLFVIPKETSGTHFTPFLEWAQLLSKIMNPGMSPELWTKIYDTHYWGSNNHGTGDKKNPKANFVTKQNLKEEPIYVESLTTGGSLVKGVKIGDGEWTKIEGLDYRTPISPEYLRLHPEFWTRGIYASGKGIPYRMLGNKFQGGAFIHPLIFNKQYGLYIQSYKLQEWTNPTPPDPLKIYLK